MSILNGAEFEHLVNGKLLGFHVPRLKTGVDACQPVLGFVGLELREVFLEVEDAVGFSF